MTTRNRFQINIEKQIQRASTLLVPLKQKIDALTLATILKLI